MKLKSLLWMPLVLAMSACGGPEVAGETTPVPNDDSTGGEVSASCTDECPPPDVYCEVCPGGVRRVDVYFYGCTCMRSTIYGACGPTC